MPPAAHKSGYVYRAIYIGGTHLSFVCLLPLVHQRSGRCADNFTAETPVRFHLGEHGRGVIAGGMLEAKSQFCENYKQGISCAASVMLGSYEVTDTSHARAGAEVNVAPLSCN